MKISLVSFFFSIGFLSIHFPLESGFLIEITEKQMLFEKKKTKNWIENKDQIKFYLILYQLLDKSQFLPQRMVKKRKTDNFFLGDTKDHWKTRDAATWEAAPLSLRVCKEETRRDRGRRIRNVPSTMKGWLASFSTGWGVIKNFLRLDTRVTEFYKSLQKNMRRNKKMKKTKQIYK